MTETATPEPLSLARLGLTAPSALAIGILVVGYFVVFPALFHDSNYVLSVATNAAVLSLISLGVWVTFTIGRINISQGAFAMIGGYTTAILSTRYGVSFWLCLPLSGAIAALAGTIIGLPILRLKGVYFAMITLSMTEAFGLAFLNGGEFTQGAKGIINIPRPDALSVFGMTIIPSFTGKSNLPFFYLSGVLLLVGIIAVWRLWTCRLGWVFRSLRQDEALAASIGINVAKYRVMAYAFCCFLGGLGGSFFAAFHQNIFPASYTVTDSIFFMLYCFLGGLDYVMGAVVGAFLLVVGFEILHEVQEYQALVYGVLMIGLILWLPNGILSLKGWRPAAQERAAVHARAARPGTSPGPAGSRPESAQGE